MTFPNSYMASCGASDLSDVSFTDSSFLPLTSNWNERSKIIRNFRDLCGIAAIGEIFRFRGILFFISSHCMRRQQPSSTRSKASFLHASAASSSFALACAPLRIAASSCSYVQSSPQSTGHPSSAYRSSAGPAGWFRTSFLGYINPFSSDNLLCDGVSGVSFLGMVVCRGGVAGGGGGAVRQYGVRKGVSFLQGGRGGSCRFCSLHVALCGDM